jgi:hypothetical protein
LPELRTVPTATTSETLESDAEEEHRCNKQISSTAKLPAANPSELRGEAATDLSAVRYTSPTLSTSSPLTVEGEEDEGHGSLNSLIKFNVNNESLHNLIPPSLALHRWPSIARSAKFL